MPFQPEEFTDRYREQLESLIASKEPVPSREQREPDRPTVGKVIDIMTPCEKALNRSRHKKWPESLWR